MNYHLLKGGYTEHITKKMNYQLLNREYVEYSTIHILCLSLTSLITQRFFQGISKVRDDCKMNSVIMEY